MVYDWLYFVKCFLCSSFVVSFDSCVYFFDESMYYRVMVCVVFMSFFRLNGVFFS